MTTRDPRSRPPASPSDPQGPGRDPTQSLQIDPPDDDDDFPEERSSHPSLALGTADRIREEREERTKIESPNARVKTPAPERAPSAKPVSRSGSKPAATKPPPLPKGSDDPDRIGTQLGSYKVHELLGKGGMGYVYRAEHVKLGREVALKLLRTDYAKRRDAVFRFIQEARTVNRIRHRNIVDVPDIVELDDGTTFIVMEFLRGMSLGKWARTGVDLPRALAVLVQICDGLAAAHSVSVVHRDLKPDNVIVVPTQDGAELVKLLDFGVAKLLNRDDEDIGFQTAAGSVIGTPAYMSPEQAGGMAVDHRSDIYSLGAIMYELFCGQPMFRGRSFGEYVRKHLTETPVRPRLTTAGAELDERLEAMIMKCLEKEPNARFNQIVELRDALLSILGTMETHPPQLANLTASGMRPAPLVTLPSVPSLPRVPTPQPPGVPGALGSGPQLAPQPGHPSGQFGYSQYSHVMPPQAQEKPTPWWVWFGGGAVAVALGVGAAVWYAGRGDDVPVAPERPVAAKPADPAPAPAKQPVVAPAPTVTPQIPQHLAVRFDSLPSGHVFADGKSAELCTTPCAFDIDVGDGGALDRRTYFVKADGYMDGMVVVDLTAPQREFSVTLSMRPGERPLATSKKGRPVKGTKIVKGGKSGDDAQVVKPDPEQAGETTPETKPETKPGKKNDDELDPSHTLDPFKRKRP